MYPCLGLCLPRGGSSLDESILEGVFSEAQRRRPRVSHLGLLLIFAHRIYSGALISASLAITTSFKQPLIISEGQRFGKIRAATLREKEEGEPYRARPPNRVKL